MSLFRGRFVKSKGLIKKILLFFRIELLKQKDGSNIIRKIYSKKPSIQFFKENNSKKGLTVVEIGVWRGDNTKHLLKVLPIKKIYAIDPWMPFSSSEHDLKTMNSAEIDTRKKLAKYGEKVQIIKLTSNEAVKHLPNEIDFVYIDGDHSYEFVKQDIENYYKILNIGGILAGDDIANRKVHNGVAKALAEFTVKNNLDFFIEKNNWWIIKK